jgi:hypothetical protein
MFLVTIFGANYMVENYMEKISENKIEKKKDENKIKIEKKAKINVDNKIDILRRRFELK